MPQTINANARECRFAVHIPAKTPDAKDLHLIKLAEHFPDGSIKPKVILASNVQRPFWITRPNRRNYNDKKEWTEKENVLEYSCNQSELRDKVANALDKVWSREGLKQLSSSPYLYGSDISSTAIIKQAYQKKYPNVQTKYSVATFDVETDVVHGTNEITMATVAFNNIVYTCVQASYLSGFADIQRRVDTAMEKYLGEYIVKRNLVCELVVCDTEYDVIKMCINKAHELKPDFFAIWNMDFDIPKVIAACERVGVDPKDIFCDPIVPSEYRYFRYKQGPKKKVTASGKVMPINPAAQWHVVECPCSFTVIDAMCVYKQIRAAKQEEPSYSLDAILTKELGIRKLKFTEADQYMGIKWHQFMSTEYKIEYIIYHRFDCISMLELDEKTKDLGYTIASYSGVSDFASFKSQPKRIADAMHFFCLENDLVFGTTGFTAKKSDDSVEEDDGSDGEPPEEVFETMGLGGWIITLPAHLVTNSGLACISEDPNIRTNIRAFVADSDAVSAYPSCTEACNVSKETTKREIIKIDGLDEYLFKMSNINLLSGHVNAIEYCTSMMGFPTLLDLDKLYMASKTS